MNGLGGRWVIGTGPQAHIRIADEFVSAAHAELILLPDGALWVRDLASTNGTRVRRPDGTKRVDLGETLRLGPGDVLVLSSRTSIPYDNLARFVDRVTAAVPRDVIRVQAHVGRPVDTGGDNGR